MPKVTQTRTALIRQLLMRPEGASLAELCKATGWQAHSARAAISGLRKAGHAVDRSAADNKADGAVYRITNNPAPKP